MALKCLKPATVVSPLYLVSPGSCTRSVPRRTNLVIRRSSMPSSTMHGNAGLPNDPTAQDDGNSRTSTCFSGANSIVVLPDVL